MIPYMELYVCDFQLYDIRMRIGDFGCFVVCFFKYIYRTFGIHNRFATL